MSEASHSELTRILGRLQSGEIDPRAAASRLFEIVYDELHRLASSLMRAERADHTLQPTALIHEAYLRLLGAADLEWESRAHFFGIAARAMRQILVEYARRRNTAKRQGGWERVTLDDALGLGTPPDVKILRLEDILNELDEIDARMRQVAELRIFTGMRHREIAHVLGVSTRTVENEWSVAKMWISRKLAEDGLS